MRSSSLSSTHVQSANFIYSGSTQQIDRAAPTSSAAGGHLLAISCSMGQRRYMLMETLCSRLRNVNRLHHRISLNPAMLELFIHELMSLWYLLMLWSTSTGAMMVTSSDRKVVSGYGLRGARPDVQDPNTKPSSNLPRTRRPLLRLE